MTITLTKEELEDYTEGIRHWYVQFIESTINNMKVIMTPEGPRVANLEELRVRFRKEVPKPSWRTLL